MLRIEFERRKRGWTQTELSYHAKMTMQEISRIERGWKQPYSGESKRLSEVLGIPEDELTDELSEFDDIKPKLVNQCKKFDYKRLNTETLTKIVELLKEAK